jgi:hypothetical protein
LDGKENVKKEERKGPSARVNGGRNKHVDGTENIK